MLSKKIGIDLGTSTVLVYVKGEGVVVNEPAVMATDEKGARVLAVGRAASELVGRGRKQQTKLHADLPGMAAHITASHITYASWSARSRCSPLTKPIRWLIGAPSAHCAGQCVAQEQGALQPAPVLVKPLA